jgi:hypothetical protein
MTGVTPSLPFVTALGTELFEIITLRTALAKATRSSAAAALGLVNVVILELDFYAPVLAFEQRAVAADYAVLR